MSSSKQKSVKPRTPLPINNNDEKEKSDSENEQESCPICIEPFTTTKSTKKITCPYCNYSACRECTEQFLTNAELCQDPKCMNCKKVWMTSFIHTTFTKSFYLGDLKHHRAEVLRQRETSLLPGTQIVIEMKEKLLAEDNDLKNEENKLEEELMRIRDRIREIKDRRYHILRAYKSNTVDIKMEQAERKVFVRACPAVNCKGFLSQRWKCGLCNVWVCSTCHAIKGTDENAEHKCDDNDVKSAELIMKDTKPCPSCGVRIFKTFGCNQFWCTHCHTAFDWATGKKLEATRIHNPYYFDYLSKNGHNSNANMNLGVNCDNLDSRILSVAGGSKCGHITPELLEIMRFRNELLETLERYPRPDNIDRNIDIRIRFMKNEINQDRFGALLQQRDKKNNKLYAEADILRMFTDVSLDHLLYAQTHAQHHQEVMLAYERLVELRTYTNKCLIELSRQYNNQCIAISNVMWIVSNTNEIQNKVKKSKKKTEEEYEDEEE